MLDTEALIEPGRGLGGVLLGTLVADLLATADPLRVIEIPGEDDDQEAVTIHSFGAIRTWSVDGRVVQVGAFEGYGGRTAAGIGIGTTLAEIQSEHGDVAPLGAEAMVTVPSVPGVGIETTAWAAPDAPDPSAHVIQIFVHELE